MAHAQKPDFVFRRKGRVHLNRRGRQFSRLLAAEVCASAEVMLDTPCSEVVWRVLATQSIRQFPLHFPSRASPCAITVQLESTFECPLVCLTGCPAALEGTCQEKKREELGLKYKKIYWLMGISSALSIHNKVMVYKQILQPVWTYGIQLWGCTKLRNNDIIQRFQNMILRNIVDVPWYIRNAN